MREQDDFADAFLTEELVWVRQERVGTASGGTRLVTVLEILVRGSVRPGDAAQSEEGGRIVRVQLGEVRLPAQVVPLPHDLIRQGTTVWEVVGADEALQDRMLTVASVKRQVP